VTAVPVAGYRHPTPSPRMVDAGRPWGQAPVDLATCYELCRRLQAAHGRTYYLATRFLRPEQRRHVWALYGFARYADDLVDHLDLSWSPLQRRARLEGWSDELLASLQRGASADPVLAAVGATVAELGIATADLRAFLRSMAMDLEVTRYATYGDLARYMHGSAAVIGTMMLPILGVADGVDEDRARGPAMDLGVAFQLTNFIRDVAEDWDRGRIYLPLEDLDRFGVTEWDFHSRQVGPAFRRLLAFQVARTRHLYRRAEAGWALLAPASRICIRVAHRLYGGILDAVEAADYQVFRVRAHVPTSRRLRVAVREVVRPSRPGAPWLP
jgi:15-cis-phytoene synthase